MGMDDDDETESSIHDLDNAPPPGTNKSLRSLSSLPSPMISPTKRNRSNLSKQLLRGGTSVSGFGGGGSGGGEVGSTRNLLVAGGRMGDSRRLPLMSPGLSKKSIFNIARSNSDGDTGTPSPAPQQPSRTNSDSSFPFLDLLSSGSSRKFDDGSGEMSARRRNTTQGRSRSKSLDDVPLGASGSSVQTLPASNHTKSTERNAPIRLENIPQDSRNDNSNNTSSNNRSERVRGSYGKLFSASSWGNRSSSSSSDLGGSSASIVPPLPSSMFASGSSHLRTSFASSRNEHSSLFNAPDGELVEISEEDFEETEEDDTYDDDQKTDRSGTGRSGSFGRNQFDSYESIDRNKQSNHESDSNIDPQQSAHSQTSYTNPSRAFGENTDGTWEGSGSTFPEYHDDFDYNSSNQNFGNFRIPEEGEEDEDDSEEVTVTEYTFTSASSNVDESHNLASNNAASTNNDGSTGSGDPDNALGELREIPSIHDRPNLRQPQLPPQLQSTKFQAPVGRTSNTDEVNRHHRGSFAYRLNADSPDNVEGSECFDPTSRDRADSQSSHTDNSTTHGGRNGPQKRTTVFGYLLPPCLSCCCRPIRLKRITTFLVTKLPCFWFRPYPYTEKAILGRLNALVALFSAVQVAACLYIVIILFAPRLTDRDLPDTDQDENFHSQETAVVGGNNLLVTCTWNQNGNILLIGLCALVTLITTAMNVRVIRSVNLVGAVRYLWVLRWLVPIQFFFVLNLFDYFQTVDVWVKFIWRDSTMAVLRRYFCNPTETFNTLCTVPVYNTIEQENHWCEINYNSTKCVEIRDAAQEKVVNFLFIFYDTNAAWGIGQLVLLLLTGKTLESIMSQPLVQKSTESNMPSWLLLPTASCLAVGFLYAFAATSVLNMESQARSEAAWIGPMFILAGGLFFIGACLAWFMSSYTILSTRDKRSKSVAILSFIVIMASLLVMLTVLFSSAITFTVSLVDTPVSDQRRGDIACAIDATKTCTQCDQIFNKCPEWEEEDVTKVLQAQAKSAATLAAISIMYTILALRFGFNQRRHLSMYQIEYV